MMKQYEEEIVTKRTEELQEFLQELFEDENVQAVQVQKTGQGWIVYWTEREEA